jgi:hypothetical protein
MTVRVSLLCAAMASALPEPAAGASREDLDFVIASSLPPAVVEAFEKHADIAFEARLNPFYLQGDFDGDGRRDTAVLIKDRKTGTHGIGIALKAGRIAIVGAGRKIGDDPGDFAWMDAWYVEPKGNVAQGATDEAPPKLKGDAIMVIKTEAASALLYSDGKRFRLYQQGD